VIKIQPIGLQRLVPTVGGCRPESGSVGSLFGSFGPPFWLGVPFGGGIGPGSRSRGQAYDDEPVSWSR
jgi:hypothetical protein